MHGLFCYPDHHVHLLLDLFTFHNILHGHNWHYGTKPNEPEANSINEIRFMIKTRSKRPTDSWKRGQKAYRVMNNTVKKAFTFMYNKVKKAYRFIKKNKIKEVYLFMKNKVKEANRFMNNKVKKAYRFMKNKVKKATFKV